MKKYGISQDVMRSIWMMIPVLFVVLIQMANFTVLLSIISCILVFIATLVLREVWPVPVTEEDVYAIMQNTNRNLTHKEVEERLNEMMGFTNTWRKVNREQTALHLYNLMKKKKIIAHEDHKVLDEESGGEKEILDFSLNTQAK